MELVRHGMDEKLPWQFGLWPPGRSPMFRTGHVASIPDWTLWWGKSHCFPRKSNTDSPLSLP